MDTRVLLVGVKASEALNRQLTAVVDVRRVRTVGEAAAIARGTELDAVVFGQASLQVGRQIKSWRARGCRMVFLFITSTVDSSARACLSAGAGFLCPSFSADELVLRIRAGQGCFAGAPLRFAERVVSPTERSVVGPDGQQTLTPTEARLIARLADSLGKVVPTSILLRDVWGIRQARTRAVANTVMRLRVKIEADPTRPEFLQTVRGVGYRLHITPNHAAVGTPLSAHPLIGRDDVLADAQDRLNRLRYVWLTGPLGVGKSQLGHTLAARLSTPIHYCDVSKVSDEATLLAVLAAGLNIRTSGATPLTFLGKILAESSIVLVLDGADDCVALIARLVTEWFQCASLLQIIITSRESPVTLESLRMGPLSLISGMQLMQNLSPSPLKDELLLVEIVERLDRLPLALRLAAQSLEVLSIKQLRDRLGDRLSLLCGPVGSLADVFSRVWASLDSDEQALLGVCALFAGSFNIDRLEVIDPVPNTRSLANILARLVRTSWLESGENAQFYLLNTTRIYILERFAERPDAHTLMMRFVRSALTYGERLILAGDSTEFEMFEASLIAIADGTLPAVPLLMRAQAARLVEHQTRLPTLARRRYRQVKFVGRASNTS